MLIDLVKGTIAVLVGFGVGYSFGLMQENARLRNAALQAKGNFKLGVKQLPGTGRRIAYLLLSLLAAQLICPLLFRDGVQWLVSGGLLIGYGIPMWGQMRARLREQ
ncbi:MAG TPA: hypothetical protein VIM69_04950 [Opitutaceae bacterium]